MLFAGDRAARTLLKSRFMYFHTRLKWKEINMTELAEVQSSFLTLTETVSTPGPFSSSWSRHMVFLSSSGRYWCSFFLGHFKEVFSERRKSERLQTPSVEEDHVARSKAPEQLHAPCGETSFSQYAKQKQEQSIKQMLWDRKEKNKSMSVAATGCKKPKQSFYWAWNETTGRPTCLSTCLHAAVNSLCTTGLFHEARQIRS